MKKKARFWKLLSILEKTKPRSALADLITRAEGLASQTKARSLFGSALSAGKSKGLQEYFIRAKNLGIPREEANTLYRSALRGESSMARSALDRAGKVPRSMSDFIDNRTPDQMQFKYPDMSDAADHLQHLWGVTRHTTPGNKL